MILQITLLGTVLSDTQKPTRKFLTSPLLISIFEKNVALTTVAVKNRPKKIKECKIPEEKYDILQESSVPYRNEYFRHKSTILFKGDVLNPKTFDKEFIDLTVTSPPYNVDIQYNSNKDDLTYEEYLEFSEKWMTNVFNWSKPQARFLLNIPLDKNKGGQKAVGADLTKVKYREAKAT